MIATLSADRQTVTLTGRMWRETFPADAIAGRIRLYETLAARKHPRTGEAHAFADHYRPTLQALKAVQIELRTPPP